jgi:cytochrome P450
MVSGNQIGPDELQDARATAHLAGKALYDSIEEIVVERRASGSEGDDLIGKLLRAEHEGRMLDSHDVCHVLSDALTCRRTGTS